MSDQADVWADIAQKSARMRANSPTAAMEALFLDHATAIDRFVEACAPVDHQVGAMFAVGGRVIGFDLFDRPRTLRKLLPKLVRSVSVDALDAAAVEPRGNGGVRLHAEGQLFLYAVSEATQHNAKAVGAGDDVRMTAPGLVGAALIVDQGVLHISAFSDAPGM